MNKKLQAVITILVCIVLIGLVVLYTVNAVNKYTDNTEHPSIVFELENLGSVKMELYPEYAPNTVANILKLAESGYYNDKVIYGKDSLCLYLGRDETGEIVNPTRSMVSSSIEAGADDDTEYGIEGEFVVAGYKNNTLSHEKGVVSLIRSDYTTYFSSLADESYSSGNAQIGIMMSDEATSLDGTYAAFGKIVEGLDILENIYNNQEIAQSDDESSSSSSGIDEFASYPKIVSVTVDTHGIDYGEPETVDLFDYSSYLYDYMSQNYSN